ncbi:MAG: lipoxygenase [Oligoflexus sp.]|nr:lipoxygenase [Oligoflexus sp.]
MSSFKLPQLDTSSTRKAELDLMRSEYAYNMEYGAPIGAIVHDRDKAGTIWTIKLLQAMFKVRSNTEAVIQKSAWSMTKPMPQKSPKELAELLLKKDLRPLLAYYIPDLGQLTNGGRPNSLDDYQLVFQKVEKTYASAHFLDDKYFAQSFVTGPNPNMFSKLLTVPSNFPITNLIFRKTPAFATDDLNQAIAEGRVFISDYKMLSSMVPGMHPQQQKKYMFAPIVLFAREKAGKDLVPFAIQCGQDPAAFPIMTPVDNWSWQIAKGTAWVAHYCYQELLTHLGFTHLLMEPMVLATRRMLHANHPLSGLLLPHFEGTMPINSLAITSLIQDGQAVDRLIGSNRNSNYGLIAKHRLAYSFNSNFLPTRLQNSGVASAKDLPNYPYRDDALPIWQAIHNWVAAYVDVYYPNDGAVRADFEVQAWAADISSNEGGRVLDFASNGGVNDKNQLIDVCTMIIFTGGPQHAAVNFPQLTDLSFLPGGPMAGYRPAPENTSLTEQDYLNFLPPLDVALKQWQTIQFLGTAYYTKLGLYNLGHFTNLKVLAASAKFIAELIKIEFNINARNKTRLPYEHLLPSRIPQSTNI